MLTSPFLIISRNINMKNFRIALIASTQLEIMKYNDICLGLFEQKKVK